MGAKRVTIWAVGIEYVNLKTKAKEYKVRIFDSKTEALCFLDEPLVQQVKDRDYSQVEMWEM